MDKLITKAEYFATRGEIVEQVINLGPLDINGAMRQGAKDEIQDYFIQNAPSIKNFAEFLNEKYGKCYFAACVFDNGTSFNPFAFAYNMAGLQYKYRDENKIIKLECLEWSFVAKTTIQQIKANTYLQIPAIYESLNSYAKRISESLPYQENRMFKGISDNYEQVVHIGENEDDYDMEQG